MSEAQKLAQDLDAYHMRKEHKQAAALLRRQEAAIKELRGALEALLRRDMRNTCQHEETHRGGAIWEICHRCGMKWADDEGGKPNWRDPSEWVKAEAALSNTKDLT